MRKVGYLKCFFLIWINRKIDRILLLVKIKREIQRENKELKTLFSSQKRENSEI